MPYTITEPHPTVPQNSYTKSGRGGSGNFFRAPATTPAAGVPTKAGASVPVSYGRFHSGRGGAGNFQSASVRTVLLYDEDEFRSKSIAEEAQVCHVGRGGAGNAYGSKRKESDASSSGQSASSSSSRKSGFLGRLTSFTSRH